MILKVTRQNVRDGVRCNGRSCPVALAMKKHFGKFLVAVTSSLGVWVGQQTFTPSLSLLNQIRRFDRFGKFKPGNYRLTEVK